MNLTTMNPDVILQDEGLLPLVPERVDWLVQSIGQIGLLYPITVERRGGMVFVVAGRHRLAAVKKLKLAEVPCLVFSQTSDVKARSNKSRIAEIDENLYRGLLTKRERAMLTDLRKELYEKEKPRTTKGASQAEGKRRAHGKSQSKVRTEIGRDDAFIDDASKNTGRSRSSVAQDARRGEKLKDELPFIGDTSLDKGVEMDALIKLKKLDADKAADLVKRACNGEQVSAVEVLAQRKPPEPAPETEQEAVEPDSNVVVLSALPKPEALQNENADPSQQRTPLDAPSPYLDALAALRRIKGIDVSVVDTVPPRDRMAFKAAVHEASLRLDELKDALGLPIER